MKYQEENFMRYYKNALKVYIVLFWEMYTEQVQLFNHTTLQGYRDAAVLGY